MARPRKLVDRRQNRETINVVLGDAPDAVPEPPQPLKAKARQVWEAFWRSPVAAALDPASDGFIVARWIAYVDEWYTIQRTLRKEGLMTTGSQGQPVLHPLAKHRQALETAIAAIEKQLGLTPQARAQLGISINAYKRSSAEALLELQQMEAEPLEE